MSNTVSPLSTLGALIMAATPMLAVLAAVYARAVAGI